MFVVADAAPGSYNVGVHEVEACITERTRAIVVAHIAGEPADVAGISALATRHGIPLVEDCAQAHAARLHGRPLGTYGQIAAFSTMFDKHHHTGGQGGVVYTADRALHENARRHADRGKPFGLAPGSTSVVAALNLNMDELHAAIGRVQLDRLHDNVDRRRRVAGALAAQVASVTSDAVIVPPQIAGAEPSFWYLRLRIDIARLSCSKPEFAAALAAKGIPLRGEAVLPHSHSWFAHDGTADTNPSLSTDACSPAQRIAGVHARTRLAPPRPTWASRSTSAGASVRSPTPATRSPTSPRHMGSDAMRIAFVLNGLRTDGGVQTSTAVMAERVAAPRGRRADGLAARTGPLTQRCRCPEFTDRHAVKTRAKVALVRQSLRDWRPDIAHSQLWSAGLAGRIAAMIDGIPSAFTEVTALYPELSWRRLQVDRLLHDEQTCTSP